MDPAWRSSTPSSTTDFCDRCWLPTDRRHRSSFGPPSGPWIARSRNMSPEPGSRREQTCFVSKDDGNQGGLAVNTDTLESEVGRLKPAAHGLTFLPLLAGERSIGFALHATGAIAGLTLATTPVDLVRAGLEAIAIEFARVDRRLDQILPGAELLVAS